MRHFERRYTADETEAAVARYQASFRTDGFGFSAVEPKAGGGFIGLVGLARVRFAAAFAPAVEIGWRLDPDWWRQGLASEAALAARDFGLATVGLDRIVALTAQQNMPSQAVMRKIGMCYDPASDFDHPDVSEGHPLRPHVLYRISRADWQGLRA